MKISWLARKKECLRNQALKSVVLVGLALSGPAHSGSLGAADHVMFGVNARSPDYTKTSFKVHVGHRALMGTDRSVASFVDGRFKIITEPSWIEELRREGRIKQDATVDESGITPDQVISFDYSFDGNAVNYTVLYRDATGKVEMATWNILWAPNEAKSFWHAFLKWMSKSN